MHEDVICRRSKVIQDICASSECEDDHVRKIHLPKTDERAVQTYLQWAYSSPDDLFELLIAEISESNGFLDEHRSLSRFMCCSRLCSVWTLADYLQDTDCKNRIIDNLIDAHVEEPFEMLSVAGFCSKVYEGTRPGSGLRRWLVDSLAPIITVADFKARCDHYPRDMLVDMNKALIYLVEGGKYDLPNRSSADKYYE